MTNLTVGWHQRSESHFFSSSSRLGCASCEIKALSSIHLFGLQIVLFFTEVPIFWCLTQSVSHYTPCPGGKCLSTGAADRRTQGMCSWFVPAVRSSGAPWQPLLGLFPLYPLMFSLPYFQDVETHRAKQHVQCLTAEVFLSTPITR